MFFLFNNTNSGKIGTTVISNDTIGILLLVIILLVVALSPFFTSICLKIFRNIKRFATKSITEEEKISTVKEIQVAIEALAIVRRGATIVIDTKNETSEYINYSEFLDSRITSNLLINIFWGSETPLHDGAAIIKNNRLDQASAFITNLSKQKVPKKFGTRHRSALGLSEVTKSIIIVLSEETQKIRIFYKSKWEETTQKELFEKILGIWV